MEKWPKMAQNMVNGGRKKCQMVFLHSSIAKLSKSIKNHFRQNCRTELQLLPHYYTTIKFIHLIKEQTLGMQNLMTGYITYVNTRILF